MPILPIIYEKEYNEILNEANIRIQSIAEACGNAAGHMIKYMSQTNLQSADWVSSAFDGYRQFNKAERTVRSKFLSSTDEKIYNIIYKSAKDVLLEVQRKDNHIYSIYYKDEPKCYYWTKEQLIDPEFIRSFLRENASDEHMNKDWLEYEMDKLIRRYK